MTKYRMNLARWGERPGQSLPKPPSSRCSTIWFFVALVMTLGPSCTQTRQIFTVSEDEDGLGGAGPDNVETEGSAGGPPDISNTGPGPTGSNLMVDGGDRHSCGVVDGRLYCWGENQTGALGLGDFAGRLVPSQVGDSSDWSAVGAGDGFSCGIRAGLVFCWGTGSSGQLGNGQFSLASTPQEVTLPGPAQSLSVGHQHACAIVDGSLLCWGNNSEGQLAQGDPFTGPGVNSSMPLLIPSGVTWSRVSAGQGHTCAIQTDGALWCWGRNARGELGLGAAAPDQIRIPDVVGSDTDWTDIAAGQNHTCGIRAGELYCWGDNGSNQLGTDVADFTDDLALVVGVQDATHVTVDTFHTCVLSATGTLGCWGRNIEGILGDGTIEARAVPTAAMPTDAWDQVAAGRFHTCGVRFGAILCSGENSDGRLGTGDLERRRVFTATALSE